MLVFAIKLPYLGHNPFQITSLGTSVVARAGSAIVSVTASWHNPMRGKKQMVIGKKSFINSFEFLILSCYIDNRPLTTENILLVMKKIVSLPPQIAMVYGVMVTRQILAL